MSGNIYLSDYFGIDPEIIEDFGAFNTSILADIPVFIDPFLLFHSENEKHKTLHDGIIRYLLFLQAKSSADIDAGRVKHWFTFPEVRQTWIGFSAEGNGGRGLGSKFANSLKRNFNLLFSNDTSVTKGRHLEKLCLIEEGVGKDMISDFVTNLIKEYLLEYTQEFARLHLSKSLCHVFSVEKVCFNYDTESWQTKRYYLPHHDGEYILLVPKDLLTSENTWINRSDLINNFVNLPKSIENDTLRGLLSSYIEKNIPQGKAKNEDAKDFNRRRRDAIRRGIQELPEVLDYYIRDQENDGDAAVLRSSARVMLAESLFVVNFKKLIQRVSEETNFYELDATTVEGAVERLNILNSVLQTGGAELLQSSNGTQLSNEAELTILRVFLWGNRSLAGSSVNKNIAVRVITKLGSNSNLGSFLDKQQKLNEADIQQGKTPCVVAIFCFSEDEYSSAMELARPYDDKSLAVVVLNAVTNKGKSKMYTKVFISYTHDSPEHKQKVYELSEYLRDGGIDCQIDQYVHGSPPQGWANWMMDEVETANFVLVVATETYNKRFRKHEEATKGLGAIWEGGIITQELYESSGQNSKFIPITFTEQDVAFRPSPLRNATYYDLSQPTRLNELYYYLTNQPSIMPRPLGEVRKRGEEAN